jgi:hypothetical protein
MDQAEFPIHEVVVNMQALASGEVDKGTPLLESLTLTKIDPPLLT